MNYITEKQIRTFLLSNIGLNEKDPVNSSSARAYRDLCRTIDFISKNENARLACYNAVRETIQEAIFKLSKGVDYDDWHESLCNLIIKKYPIDVATLHYGQAQKWVNMTMKYLVVLGYPTALDVIEKLHIPIDNIILDRAEEEGVKISTELRPWSKINPEAYKAFQTLLREKGLNLCWEFDAWEQGTKSIEKEKVV